MSITSTAKVKNPTQAKIANPKLNGETTVQVDNVKIQESQNLNRDNKTKFIPLPAPAEPSDSNHLTIPGNFQISDTINLAGIRPIASSDLRVLETVNLAGVRPIASSNLQVSETISLMGRPITSSKLKVSETILMSGLRPIASNYSEDDILIGYLD